MSSRTIVADVPRFDATALPVDLGSALAELLLTLADDEFVRVSWTPNGPESRRCSRRTWP